MARWSQGNSPGHDLELDVRVVLVPIIIKFGGVAQLVEQRLITGRLSVEPLYAHFELFK